MKRYLKYFVFVIGLLMFININVRAVECTEYNSHPDYMANPESACKQDSKCIWTGSYCTKKLSCSDYNESNYSGNYWKTLCGQDSNCHISLDNNKCITYTEWEDEKEAKEEMNANINEVYGCTFYNYEDSCKNSSYYSCIWVDADNSKGGYCNVDKSQYITCGDAFDIPSSLPPLTSFGINILKIMTPVILIILSIITLVKAVAASKEDEIKKATSTLKRRVIAGVMVFFVIYIVQFVIMKVADSSETRNISDCLDCFINNNCSSSIYYKNNVGGINTCYYLDGTSFTCPENNVKIDK